MSEVSSVSRAKLLKALNGDLEVARVIESLTSTVADDIPGGLAQVSIVANLALAMTDALKLGVYRQVQPSNQVRGADGVNVGADAAGPIVSLDLAYVIAAVRAYMPKQQPQTPDDDASAILASRVFGRR